MPDCQSNTVRNILQKFSPTTKARVVIRTWFEWDQIVFGRGCENLGKYMCCQACLEGLFLVIPQVAYMAVVWKRNKIWRSQSTQQEELFQGGLCRLLFTVIFCSKKVFQVFAFESLEQMIQENIRQSLKKNKNQHKRESS